MCSFGERRLTVQGREADAGRLRFGGSGSALLAARGNCGPCFVRGEGALRRVISVRQCWLQCCVARKRACGAGRAEGAPCVRQSRGACLFF